jgi:ATP-dependent Clp protease ATP-binding subunit ClpA
MGKRTDGEMLKVLLNTAAGEARQRGDRRLGTDHLLLGLLHDAPASEALGVTLEIARAASDALDKAALAAIGVDVDHPAATAQGHDNARGARFRRLPPLTSGSRAVLKDAIDRARPRRSGRITTDHFVLALIGRQRPDPAAELLGKLGVDPAEVAARVTATQSPSGR